MDYNREAIDRFCSAKACRAILFGEVLTKTEAARWRVGRTKGLCESVWVCG